MLKNETKETKEIAYGRVGFLGNPSDMYGGKCISFTFGNYVEVNVRDSDKLFIHGESSSDDNLIYNGSNDLIKATVKYLGLEDRLRDGPVEISYHRGRPAGIPYGHGLSGSSAIIIAAIKSLNKHFGLGIDDAREIAEKALHIEVDELNIAAGFQDRYIISHGGVCYMDFTGKEFMFPAEIDGYGKIEKLKINRIPYFLSLSVQPKSSAAVHNSLRKQFLDGGIRAREIKYFMDKIAFLADIGRETLERGDWASIGDLMKENTKLREEISPHLKIDGEMIDYALDCGALGAKVAGSGGAVVILSDNKKVFKKMSESYPCLRPKIVEYL